MIVIIAEINKYILLLKSDILQIKEARPSSECEKLFLVDTVKKLETTLEANKDQDFLLFSNFPPNIAYVSNYTAGNGNRFYTQNAVEPDSYSKSKTLFKNISSKYHFRSIHFITAAPIEKLTDDIVKSLFPGLPVTTTRKEEWMQSEKGYRNLYVCFIIEKIKEFA